MMTESEFLQHSDGLLAYIEDQIDEQGLDFDCQRSGNVLTIEADDGTQIIVNRHAESGIVDCGQKRRLSFCGAGRPMAGYARRSGIFRRFIRGVVGGVRRNGLHRAV